MIVVTEEELNRNGYTPNEITFDTLSFCLFFVCVCTIEVSPVL